MYLGIDLGTSNSAIVGNTGSELRLFKTSDGKDVLPSVIYIDKRGHKFVGTRAYEQAQLAPGNVAQGFKRLLGTASPIQLSGSDVELTAEGASAEVLRTLLAQARSEVGDVDIKGTVITIPAAFNQMQSEATLSAARAAGLDLVGLLQEPIAAAMASLAASSRGDGQFLVYDLGGGTFDVALVQSVGGSVNIVAHEGINMLGGRDFDLAILNSVVRPWLSKTFALPDDFQKDPAYKRLLGIARIRAEQAKIELSTKEEAVIFVSDDEARAQDQNGEDMFVEVPITRVALEALIQSQVNDSIELCRKMLRQNSYTNDDIDRIVFIGGPSRMPYIRTRVPTELGIPADLKTDPMTAVARGAAIFAESREWGEAGSSRKAARGTAKASGNVDIRYDYAARTSEERARLRIRPAAEVAGAGYRLFIAGPNGWQSGEIQLNGDVGEVLELPQLGENRFRVTVTDAQGAPVAEAATEFSITRTFASAAGVPATQTVAVKVLAGPLGSQYNRLQPLVVKGTVLPAQDTKSFRAARTLVGGEAGYIDIEFFNQAEGVDDPELNLFIGSFRLSAERHLEPGQQLRSGQEIIVHWQMDDNGILALETELPDLGVRFETRNFYVPSLGHQNFEGDDGQRLAQNAVEKVEASLQDTASTLGEKAKPEVESLQRRLARQKELLATSSDAEARRSVSEEARHIQQELARLQNAPENRKAVLLHELEGIEDEFADIAEDCDPATVERLQQLGRSARESLGREDFDKVRQIVDQMRAIYFRALSQQPGFIVGYFEMLEQQRFAAIDKALHDDLVRQGREAISADDLSALKAVIGQMIGNRVPTQNNAKEMMVLAGLTSA